MRHGGGKRCKFEACGKSAQGSTDFCKAHGGGKRCSWGHPGSEYSNQPGGPCNSFARGKTGLCALHNGLVQDKRVHGGVSLGSVQDPHVSKPDELKQVVTVRDMDMNLKKVETAAVSARVSAGEGSHLPMSVAVPEGRVHGGSLLAMLAGSSGLGSTSRRGLVSDPSELVKPYVLPRSWI